MDVSTDSIDQKVRSIFSKVLDSKSVSKSSTVSKSVVSIPKSTKQETKPKDVGEIFNQIVGKIESKYTPIENSEKIEERKIKTTASFLASKSLNLSSKLPSKTDQDALLYKPSPSKRVNFDILDSTDTSPTKSIIPNMPAATEYFNTTTTTPTRGILKQTKIEEPIIPQDKQVVKKLRNESEKLQKQIEKQKKELEQLKEMQDIQQKAAEDENLLFVFFG